MAMIKEMMQHMLTLTVLWKESGEGHMGYVQPSASDDDDPFAGCSDSESDEDTAAACSDDPFSDGAGSFSEISDIED